MDKSVWWITLLFFLIVIVEESYRLHDPVSNVEELIERRNLRSVGYTHFDVSYLQERATDGVQPANILNSDILRRRKRDAVSTSANIETMLHLEAHGDKFVLNVKHSDPVIHPNAQILFTDKDISRQWQGTNPDCFMTGKLTSHDAQTVVVSYCDNLKGYFHDANYTYWVESLEHYDTSSDASSSLLVARKPGGSDSWRSVSSSEHKQIKEKVASKRSENEELQRLSRQKRQFTETKQAAVTIELAIVHDEAATAYYDAGGATNDDERIEIVAMKWYGVAAEYNNPGAFYAQTTSDIGGGYTITSTYDISVTFQVKAMEFWVSNPSYIAALVNSNDNGTNLQIYRENACTWMNNNNMFKEYDTIYIETGVNSSDARSGNAAAAGTCIDGQKCAISNLLAPTLYNLEMHELGHTLNMLHDFDDGVSGTTKPECIKPNHGIMGYKYNGWSPCSIRQLSEFVGTADKKGKGACLWVENVNTSVIPLESQWPGMVLTDDEVCARMNRPGWRYRSEPANNPPKCPKFTCVDMNIGSSSYGSFRGLGSYRGRAFTNTIMGRRCGDNMYCYINNNLVRNQCIPWSATGLADSLKTVRAGGWSAWGAETNCSRACGTGVQFRQRTCNNPTPMHSPWCEGSEYEAKLCNTHPCLGDSTSPATLKTERASETCARLNANNLIGTAFENSGAKYSNHEHGQCEVKCDLKAGDTSDNRTRFGLMPDGTPCSTPVTEDVFEKYNLPKSKGRLSRCLQGYCYIFGCDNKTATTLKSRDECGICGGTGSTCSVQTGSYDTDIAVQGTIDLVTVHSGATNILIMYNFTGGGSPSYWIELWSEAGDAIIAKSKGGSFAITNNLDNPTQFAGTGWSFLSTAQFLSAFGPTNENVIIKVYNSGGGTNGVIIQFSYSVPSASTGSTTTGATTVTGATTTAAGETTTPSGATTTPTGATTTPTGATTTPTGVTTTPTGATTTPTGATTTSISPTTTTASATTECTNGASCSTGNSTASMTTTESSITSATSSILQTTTSRSTTIPSTSARTTQTTSDLSTAVSSMSITTKISSSSDETTTSTTRSSTETFGSSAPTLSISSTVVSSTSENSAQSSLLSSETGASNTSSRPTTTASTTKTTTGLSTGSTSLTPTYSRPSQLSSINTMVTTDETTMSTRMLTTTDISPKGTTVTSDLQEGLNIVIIVVIVTSSIVVVAVIAMIVVVIKWRYHMVHKSGRPNKHRHIRKRDRFRNHDTDIYIYRSSFDHSSFDPYLLDSFDGYNTNGHSEYSSFNPQALEEYSFYKG